MIQPILKVPNDRLLQKSTSVPILINDDHLKMLVQDMVDTAAGHAALGLAAPQIGAALRVIVVTRLAQEGRQFVCLLNPEITWKSGAWATEEEGCLSIPGKPCRVSRPIAVEVTYQSFPGRELKRERISGRLARVIQHEVDHLDGILIDQKQTEAVTLQ